MRIQLHRRILNLFLTILFLAGSLLPALPAAAEEQERTLRLAILSDIHVFDPALYQDGDNFKRALQSDRKLLLESSAILDAALADLAEEKSDIVLIAGDLTKDGEPGSIALVMEKLDALKQASPETGIYVINGNHDVKKISILPIQRFELPCLRYRNG